MNNTIIKFRYSIITLLLVLLNGVGAYASTPWTVNPSDYRYDMSLYLDVSFAKTKMDYSKYDVAVLPRDISRMSGQHRKNIERLSALGYDITVTPDEKAKPFCPKVIHH